MKSLGKKIGASILAASLTFSLLPALAGNDSVSAAAVKNTSNTCLGTSEIKAPVQPADKDAPWTGNYVYFGSYDGNPIKFRVLAPETDVYGGSTLFLDSDKTLFKDYFDNTAPYQKYWADSDIRSALNGTFMDSFTSLEQKAIATSVGNGGLSYADPSFGATFYGAPVSVNDKVFLLDATEVMNPAYGYSDDCGWTTTSDWMWSADWHWHEVANRKKGGSSAYWYLRSATAIESLGAGGVFNGGYLYFLEVSSGSGDGIAPALNVDRSKILFSTLVSGDFADADAEYKLTIIDEKIGVGVLYWPSISGNEISTEYTITGEDKDSVDRLSVLILDKEYGTNGASIIYYDAMYTSGMSRVAFTLPSSLSVEDWGSDYYVYIIAEDINNGKETDYASNLVKLDAPAYQFTVNNGQGLSTSIGTTDGAQIGNTVKLVANAPATGKVFDKWIVVSGNVTLADAGSYVTTFVMPSEAVEVTATYKDLTAWTKTQSNTDLGTIQIASPYEPGSDEYNLPWIGSYVYFGAYKNNPIRFRVLATETNVYGGSTLFLDSDRTLFDKLLDDDSNIWADSDIRTYLNGTFLSDSFTSAENKAITTSTGNGGLSYTDPSFGATVFVTPVSVNDKVFLLDATEVMNPAYGYSAFCGVTTRNDWTWISSENGDWIRCEAVVNHEKNSDWVLRSAASNDTESVGIVYYDGLIGRFKVFYEHAVAPALNVDRNFILFSSVISGESGKHGAEYKLTIFDPELKVAVQSGKNISVSGTKIKVPYAITGADSTNATQVSVLILDKEFTVGNTNGASVKYYGKLDGTLAATAQGTFTLPSSLDMGGWGTDYFVYIVAEDVNGTYETDYASQPVKLSNPVLTVTVTVEGNGTATASAGKGITGTEITLTRTPDTGYKFKEWQVVSGGVTVTDNKFNIGSSNVEVKAVFEKIDYTVEVVSGTADKPTANMGDKVTITAAAPAEGKEFDKWVVALGGVTIVDPSSETTSFTMPAGNVKVAATYKDIICKVTFETDGGNAVDPQSITYGNKAVEPSDPSKTGFKFSGWYKDAALTEAFDFNAGIKADTTIYAKWDIIPYYTVVEGANGTCAQGTDYKLTVKRNVADETTIDHLTGVKIDDKVLTKDTDYTAESGSVKLTIKGDALKELTIGGHTITVLFDDGEAVTSINVKKLSAVPSTGEKTSPAIWIGLGCVAAAGALFAVVLVQKKRKKIQ